MSSYGDSRRSASVFFLRSSEFLGATLVLLAATAVVTWPLPLHVTDRLSGHWDSFFGVWRLAWVADALVTPGFDLFDAPIFHPHLRTLAFSDALLIPAALAAPLRYGGLPPVSAYNLVLIGAFVTSGLAVFLLVRHLVGRADAAMLAATIYAVAPYRLDHLDHLEMQMAVFMPLSLWLWHRAVDGGASRFVAGAVGAGVLQWLSCIYYGVLFVPYALTLAAIEWASVPARRRRGLTAAVASAGVAGLLVIGAYSRPYLASRAETGDRKPEVVADYSATPMSYLAVHPHNALYAPLLSRMGHAETRLFPGALALLLAVVGVATGPWTRRRWAYLAAGLVAVDLSLGTHGLLFPLLREVAVPFRGLRAPARAGILVLLTISVLAGAGAGAVLSRMRSRGRALAAVALMWVALLTEYRTPPDLWEVLPPADTSHVGLTRASIVIDLPMAVPERLDQSVDAAFMVSRIGAWPSLVNGYSGYYPADYLTLADRIRLFPDDRALREIARVGVTVLTVHERWYGAQFGPVVAALDARRDVERIGSYAEGRHAVIAYRVSPRVESR